MKDFLSHPCGQCLMLSSLIFILAAAIGREVICFNQPPAAPAYMAYWRETARRGRPQLGELAADFALTSLNQRERVELHDLLGSKPVVLLFGSYSCPAFRRQLPELSQLVSRYGSRIDFRFVYIREAHPLEDGLIPENGSIEPIPAAQDMHDRAAAAERGTAAFFSDASVLLDGMDNRAASAYRAWPFRAYVLDREGTIVHTSAAAGTMDVAKIRSTLHELCSPE